MQKTSPENSVGWWTEEDLAEKETDSMTEPFLSDDTVHNYAIRDLLLFSAAKETILELSMKKLKMTPGILMILHSFGSDLSLHYHLHVLVSG